MGTLTNRRLLYPFDEQREDTAKLSGPWDQGPMAAQCGFNKMIEAFGLHDMRIHITGSRLALGKLNGRRFNRVSEMLLTMGKTLAMRMLLAFLLLPACALGANSVVNMSHYDLMRPDFAGMVREGIAGVIHEATFPRLERDAKYAERQRAALEAGLLWGAYHFGDGD